MIRRIACGLVGALLGVAAVTLLWWLLLLPCLLLAGALPDGPLAFLATAKGAVLAFLLSPLGLIHGALVGGVRGRLNGAVLLEVLSSPFAWVLSIGDGFLSGVLLVLSLVPGASAGMMVGLLVGGTGNEPGRLPDAALIGALVGVAASLLAFNLYLQWPGLRERPANAGPPEGESD